MRVVASIQARYNSTRLPGKVCKVIDGYPLLYHIYRRVSACTRLSGVIVAVGDKDPGMVVATCDRYNIPSFVGPEDNLIERHIKAAELTYADAILRITADCLWHDPAILWDMVNAYIKDSKKINGMSNWPDRSFSEGVDAEIWSVGLLKELRNTQSCPRDNFAAWVCNNPTNMNAFRVSHFGTQQKYEGVDMHLSIDTQEDFDKAERVLKGMKKDDYRYSSTVRAYNGN